MKTSLRNIALLLITYFLTGCNALSFLDAPVPLKEVRIISSDGANSGFPIPVDVIIVNNEDLIAVITEMDSATWFSQKAAFLPSNAGQIDVVSYEVISGNIEDPITFSWAERKEAKAIFVIARYIEYGIHKVRVDQLGEPVVKLSIRDIETNVD